MQLKRDSDPLLTQWPSQTSKKSTIQHAPDVLNMRGRYTGTSNRSERLKKERPQRQTTIKHRRQSQHLIMPLRMPARLGLAGEGTAVPYCTSIMHEQQDGKHTAVDGRGPTAASELQQPTLLAETNDPESSSFFPQGQCNREDPIQTAS